VTREGVHPLRRRHSQCSQRVVKLLWPALICLAAGGALVLVDNVASPDAVTGAMESSPSRSDPPPDLVPLAPAARPRPKHRGSELSIRKIESHLGAEAQNFVIVFDGPVPDDRISYAEDIRNVDAHGVAYTTQEWTPEKPTPLLTCGNQHFEFNPPVVVGQVDVLMPANWFTTPPGTERIIWRHDPKWYGKTPLCGPHDGYVQFAIWSPASHDPEDIRVYYDGKTRLVVEIRPGDG
jgi:hypothetical protein